MDGPVRERERERERERDIIVKGGIMIVNISMLETTGVLNFTPEVQTYDFISNERN